MLIWRHKGQYTKMKNRFSQKKLPRAKFLCYNGIMLKTKTKVKIGFVGILSVAAGIQASSIVANQALADTSSTTFEVNVVESLSVSLTTPTTGASGSMNTFLRNSIDLNITSNNTKGFTASMYSSDTNLTNSSTGTETIPTLSAAVTRGNFSVDHWGYSLNDTSAGSASSTYSPLTTSSSPITVLSRTGVGTSSGTVYFGTQTTAAKTAGTYTGTVVISVVTGEVDSSTNPAVPVDPATNSDTTAGNATYDSSNDRTVYYSTTSDSSSETTTTEISSGDTTQSYADPAGVTTRTTANINSGTPLATGLAVASAVAAASGSFFFILAKRKKDDDDEEDENMV